MMHPFFILYRKKYIISIILWILSSFISLQAQTITIRDTFYVSMDTYIDQNMPNTNFGTATLVKVGYQDRYRAFFYFDLSAIPQNAVFDSVKIILRSSGGSNNSAQSAHVITENWDDMYATWVKRTATQNWTINNIWDYTGYFVTTPEFTIPTTGTPSFHLWDVTSLVQSWFDGTLPNNGIMIKQTADNGNKGTSFYSNEDPDDNNRPRLVVKYTTTIDSLYLKGNFGIDATTDGASVSRWQNVWDTTSFYQDTNVYKPKYRNTTELMNFNPVVQFDGVNDFLKGRQNYGIFYQQKFTTITVVKSLAQDKYIWAQYDYNRNSPNHSIMTTQRFGAYNLYITGTNTVQTTPTILGIRRNDINNFSLYHNGRNERTGSITDFDGKFVGYNLILGSLKMTPISTFNGSIAEMMIFNRTLTYIELRKFNSYLALKYGITLDSNYYASNNTVIWNLVTNNQYNKGIFGLGRDNTTTLHQQISTSTTNSNNILTISSNSDFLLPNSQHTAIVNNLSFLMVGCNSNNAFIFQTTEISSTDYNSRIDFEWLVQSTNFNQTVNLKFQGLGSTVLRTAYLVKKNGNSNFSNNIIEVGTLDSNGVITGVTLNNNDYFTIFFKKLSPGGVNDNLRFWAKADYGVAISGTAVTQWRDVANNFYLTQTQVPNRPTLKTNGANFNPTINFAATNNQYFERNPDYNIFTPSYSIYIVGFNKSGQGTLMSANKKGGSINSGVVIDYDQSNTKLGFLHRYPTGTTGGDLLNPVVTMSTTSLNLLSFFRNTNTKHKFWINGGNSYLLNSFISTGFANDTITDLTVGRLGSQNMNYLDGEIAEMIIYNNENEVNRVRIESYLAVKYGISINDGIGEKYIASDSITIFWNNTNNIGYNYDIFGIGRDDLSTLFQRQSKTANNDPFFSVYLLTLVTDNLPITNQLNTTNFEVDRSFLMFGNNDSLSIWRKGLPMPDKFRYRLPRIWKFQKTGTIDKAVVVIDIADLPENIQSLPLYMLVSNTPDMTNAIFYYMTKVGNTWRLQYSFSSGSYITFAAGHIFPLRHGKTIMEGIRFPYRQ